MNVSINPLHWFAYIEPLLAIVVVVVILGFLVFVVDFLHDWLRAEIVLSIGFGLLLVWSA